MNAAPPVPAPTCVSEQLALRSAPKASPETGEQVYVLRFVNRSRRACSMRGYPGVRLGNGNRVVPFPIWWGSGPYVGTDLPVRRVRLAGSGGRAEFFVAKYRCDTGRGIAATWISAYPPDGAAPLRLRFTLESGSGILALCTPPIPDPYVNVTYVGPVYAPPVSRSAR